MLYSVLLILLILLFVGNSFKPSWPPSYNYWEKEVNYINFDFYTMLYLNKIMI